VKNHKINESGGIPQYFNSPLVRSLPLAWSWPRPRIDSSAAVTSVYEEITDKMLHAFAKYIHELIECVGDSAEKDAVALLRELVDLLHYARHE
jgi:hypothetical protein